MAMAARSPAPPPPTRRTSWEEKSSMGARKTNVHHKQTAARVSSSASRVAHTRMVFWFLLSMKTDSSAAIGVRNPALPLSENQHLLKWVEKMAELTRPAAIHWVDGSQEEYDE